MCIDISETSEMDWSDFEVDEYEEKTKPNNAPLLAETSSPFVKEFPETELSLCSDAPFNSFMATDFV